MRDCARDDRGSTFHAERHHHQPSRQQRRDHVTLTDILPAGATFQSTTAASYYSAKAQTVTCTWPNLAVGQSVPVGIAAASGSYTEALRVEADQNDPTPSNDSASATLTLAAPAGGSSLGSATSSGSGNSGGNGGSGGAAGPGLLSLALLAEQNRTAACPIPSRYPNNLPRSQATT